MTDNIFQPPAAAAMTIRQICESCNVDPNTVRMQWPKFGFTNFDRNRPATEQEAAAIRQYYANGPKSVRRSNTPAPKPVPARPMVVTVENTITKSKAKPAANHPNRLLTLVMAFTLSNIIIWSEIILGVIGQTRLFSIAGLIGSIIMALFFENARRTMTLPLRTVVRSDYDTDQTYNEAYNLAADHNDTTSRRKHFAFLWCSVITLTFCWGNGQTAYAFIAHGQPSLVTQYAFTISGTVYYVADVAARWFALLLSGLAFLSLRAISLKHM